jgi:hypothetical protein
MMPNSRSWLTLGALALREVSLTRLESPTYSKSKGEGAFAQAR